MAKPKVPPYKAHTGNRVRTDDKVRTRNRDRATAKARNKMETTAKPRAKPCPGNAGDQTSVCRNRAVDDAPNPLESQGVASRTDHRPWEVERVAHQVHRRVPL